MPPMYSDGMTPDPGDTLRVLAFLLCPAGVFAPAGDDDELAAVAELIASAKAEAARRWYEVHQDQQRN